MKRFLQIAGLVFGVMLFPAERAEAQSCSLSIPDCGTGSGHYTTNGSAYGGTSHGECKQCLDSGQPADKAVCHQCETHDLTAEQRLSYTSALRAAMSGNVPELLRNAANAGGLITYNSARRAVQIRNCSTNLLVGSISVSGAANLQLALLLPKEASARSRAVAEQ